MHQSIFIQAIVDILFILLPVLLLFSHEHHLVFPVPSKKMRMGIVMGRIHAFCEYDLKVSQHLAFSVHAFLCNYIASLVVNAGVNNNAITTLRSLAFNFINIYYNWLVYCCCVK